MSVPKECEHWSRLCSGSKAKKKNIYWCAIFKPLNLFFWRLPQSRKFCFSFSEIPFIKESILLTFELGLLKNFGHLTPMSPVFLITSEKRQENDTFSTNRSLKNFELYHLSGYSPRHFRTNRKFTKTVAKITLF